MCIYGLHCYSSSLSNTQPLKALDQKIINWWLFSVSVTSLWCHVSPFQGRSICQAMLFSPSNSWKCALNTTTGNVWTVPTNTAKYLLHVCKATLLIKIALVNIWLYLIFVGTDIRMHGLKLSQYITPISQAKYFPIRTGVHVCDVTKLSK